VHANVLLYAVNEDAAHHGAGGNLVADAHLAALAIEHRATVATFDRDFERFGVSTHRPEAG